jgi:hypothetical protein
MQGCKAHCHRLVELHLTAVGEEALAEIETYARQIEGHQTELSCILQYSKGTSKLVSLKYIPWSHH